ncbi:hypothetical protein [Caldalkalibacillus mannanilyticus]|uniref:hypothetical protein n=1 Tax=Caldalkalibacillus mannanilyticus TaxID=1418 RepID=UPI000A55D194|nr:hypothetical protein [Caldalkalibacillus mannanilyticus]
MLIYMIGISLGLLTMGFINSEWPIYLAVAVTILTSIFVQGAEGATFAIVPMIKKRITGQIAGMAGAYGNVGAVVYLTLYTMVTPQQFFFILATGAFTSFLICWLMLEEPKNAFSEEYQLSSVDLEQIEESNQSDLEKGQRKRKFA